MDARRMVAALTGVAAAWTAFNCIYVYFFLGEGSAFRIESAALIFVAFAVARAALRPTTVSADVAQGSRAGHVLLAAAACAWLAAFLALVSYPFLSDDYGFLASYRSLADVVRPFQFFRPAFALAFLALAKADGGSVKPFHITSFLLHVGSAWCVYLLAKRVTPRAPAVAAVVFLLNPVQMEAVLWASGLQDVLWTFFAMCAVAIYVRDATLTIPRIVTVAGLVGCALLSKETAICIVLLLPILDAFCFRFTRGRWMTAMYAVVVVEVAAYLAWRSRVALAEASFFVAPSRYFVKQMLVTPYEVFVHPWNRAAYVMPASALCATALFLLAIAWLASGRVTRSALVGPAFMIASVLPAYSLFFVGPDLSGARYVYFAAAGFGLLIAEAVGAVTPTRAWSSVVGAAIGVGLSVSLALNLQPWLRTADLVEMMRRAVLSGGDVNAAVIGWQARHPRGLVIKDGVPDSYQGVWVFRNGYPEFVKSAGNR